MGWRTVVVSKSSKLDLRLGYMVVRDSEKSVRVHISEISVLIIENTASSITTALLNELVKQKIKVIFCDEKQNPISELSPYYGSHDCSLKLKRQIQWESVYAKLALNTTQVNQILTDVKKEQPTKGLVQILTVTEKQFSKMEILCGKSNTDVINSDERLLIL